MTSASENGVSNIPSSRIALSENRFASTTSDVHNSIGVTSFRNSHSFVASEVTKHLSGEYILRQYTPLLDFNGTLR